MKRLRSDNAHELKSSTIAKICEDNSILMEVSPPYSSETNGVVERAIRELRKLLRTVLKRLNLDRSFWPATVRGITALHNSLYSPTYKASPYKARFKQSPNLQFIIGDLVVVKLPESKTAPKTLALPGTEAIYMGVVNKQTTVVLHKGIVHNIHPADVKPLRAGALAIWNSRYESALGDDTSKQRTSATTASPINNNEGAELLVDLARLENNQASDSDSSEEELLPIPSPPATPPAVPQAGVRGVLAYRNERGVILIHAAQVLRPTYGRMLKVAWLEQSDDGLWKPSEEGTIHPCEIYSEFTLLNGRIPEELIEDIGTFKSPARQAVHFTIAAPQFKGGASQQPATKEDIEAGKYETAKLREFATVIKNGVFGPEVTNAQHVMNMGWRLTEKENNVTGERTQKARWFCKGFMDKTRAETFAGTPELSSVLLVLLFAITRNLTIAISDVKAAFLQAEVDDKEIVVRIDPGIPKVPKICPFKEIEESQWTHIRSFAATLRPGQLRRLRKALYGDRRSPRSWVLKLKEVLRKLGFKEIQESVATKTEGDIVTCALINYVDDILTASKNGKNELCALGQEVEMTEPKELGSQEVTKFAGLELLRDDASIEVSQNSFLNELTFDLSRNRAVTDLDLQEGNEQEIDLELIPEYRTLIGKLGWAVKTRPDQYPFFAVLSKYSMKPTPRHLETVKRVLHALRSNPYALRLVKINGRPVLVGFSDASFSRKVKESRVGYKIFLWETANPKQSDTNLIGWNTRRVSVLVDSSTSAELYGIKFLVKQLPKYIELIKELWGMDLRVQLYIDCKPLFDSIRKGRLCEDSALQPELDFVLERMNMMNADIDWIPRDLQRADVLTKCIWFDNARRI
eukprot:GHVU01210331.1.p1 GENE.GHVU01210331.1~~GHVU01210331.1.p1  ORF type:complete len:861 (-),score=95.79 GHVU01210331.1:387-2969(-)